MPIQIAIIGAGGKTTALEALARQAVGSRLMTTTTHIFPPPGSLIDPTEEELRSALEKPGIVCAGTASKAGKITILPGPVLTAGLQAADWVIYEADGANRHPLKLHNASEPVILPGTTHLLIVAGLSALGRPVGEAIHRFGQNPAWQPEDLTGEETLLFCIQEALETARFPKERTSILLNQADTVSPEASERITQKLRTQGLKARSGSLQRDASFLLDWMLNE